ncbi:MAG: hypothetical protein Q9P01_21645 [Anaerolineae bacterium]|nr:hypothetical protein [Anaerolineae bacterium]
MRTESYDKNRWIQLEVSTTAQADFVTLFLFATQSELNNPNDIYWDDALSTQAKQSNPTAQPEVAAAPVAQRLQQIAATPNITPPTFVQVLAHNFHWISAAFLWREKPIL